MKWLFRLNIPCVCTHYIPYMGSSMASYDTWANGAPTSDIPLDCPELHRALSMDGRPLQQSDALSKSANQAQDASTKDALVCW